MYDPLEPTPEQLKDDLFILISIVAFSAILSIGVIGGLWFLLEKLL